ncbi:MAG: hypothetical protein VX378_07235, partial [Pseudomonadota bacterium]|nr:hypothetical protein [Pseudomonadota bacterium]
EAPEHSRRRNAIAHLKAAVAATRAENSLLGRMRRSEEPEVTPATEAPKAQDTAQDTQGIKPRRPVAQGRRAERPQPQPERPAPSEAPLRLVAEQRVDTVLEAMPETVRPRRVATEAPKKTDRVDNFAAYAAGKGVNTTAERVEAAAAFTAFVEGRELFTRPQIMQLVRNSQGGDLSREEALRAFGQLLRDEKIKKVAGGRFKVSDTIRYQDRAKASGE